MAYLLSFFRHFQRRHNSMSSLGRRTRRDTTWFEHIIFQLFGALSVSHFYVFVAHHFTNNDRPAGRTTAQRNRYIPMRFDHIVSNYIFFLFFSLCWFELVLLWLPLIFIFLWHATAANDELVHILLSFQKWTKTHRQLRLNENIIMDIMAEQKKSKLYFLFLRCHCRCRHSAAQTGMTRLILVFPMLNTDPTQHNRQQQQQQRKMEYEYECWVLASALMCVRWKFPPKNYPKNIVETKIERKGERASERERRRIICGKVVEKKMKRNNFFLILLKAFNVLFVWL